MKIFRCLFLVYFFTTIVGLAFAQEPVDSFRVKTVEVGKYRKDYTCKGKSGQYGRDSVILSFFNFFEDSISLYVENKFVFKEFVTRDTSINSTDYTGFSYRVILPSKRNILSIVSSNERVVVNVKIKRKYPFYLISVYNGVWYITPRKCFPKLL